MAEAKKLFCEKCKRTLDENQFYASLNEKKYPNKKLNICKKCITMHVDNWEPETYLWILKECDVPYIPEEWAKLMQKYASDPSKVTGTTILGRYLGKMRLNQHKNYRWKDSEFLQKLSIQKAREAMFGQGYSEQEIQKILMNGVVPMPEKPPELIASQKNELEEKERIQREQEEEMYNRVDLTPEDRMYLRLQWGSGYKVTEWIWLERLYSEMMDSYDIQTAAHKDTLKLICKASLKANQLIDAGDIEGFQKISRVYDSLMKSGNFTAAQNKADKGEYVNSISELVSICEKEGFIPRYYVERPGDRVDETIIDLKNYTHSLVVEEMNLGNLIEGAVKEMIRQEEKDEDEDVEDETSDDLTLDQVNALKDESFEEYNDFIENQRIEDENLISGEEEEGE